MSEKVVVWSYQMVYFRKMFSQKDSKNIENEYPNYEKEMDKTVKSMLFIWTKKKNLYLTF